MCMLSLLPSSIFLLPSSFLPQDSSEEDLTLHGSDSSDDSEEEFDDAASLASSVADLSSGIYTLPSLLSIPPLAQSSEI